MWSTIVIANYIKITIKLGNTTKPNQNNNFGINLLTLLNYFTQFKLSGFTNNVFVLKERQIMGILIDYLNFISEKPLISSLKNNFHSFTVKE